MRALWRLTLTALYAIALTVSGPAHATWSPSINDVMGLVYCVVGLATCEGLQPGADTVTVLSCGEGTALNGSGTQCVLPGAVDGEETGAPPTPSSWSATISNVMNLVYCLVGLGECQGLEPGLDKMVLITCGAGTIPDDAGLTCVTDAAPAGLADDGDWQLHLGLPCTDETSCDDGSWCNGAEVCRTPDTLEIEGSYCARKQKTGLGYIDDPALVPDALNETVLGLGRLGVFAPPAISADGETAYLSTGDFIEIISLVSEPLFEVLAHFPYGGGHWGHVRMDYEHDEATGSDFLYTGWGPGQIARIDASVPVDPIITVSSGDLPNQLKDASLDRLIVLDDTIVGIPEATCMPENCGWKWPSLLSVWRKSDLVFLGAVATDDSHRYDDTALNEGQFRVIGGVVYVDEAAYRLWPPDLTGVTLMASPDGQHLVYARKGHSIEIVRVDESLFDGPPTGFCYGATAGVCPEAEFENRADFFVRYPSFSCFLDNRVAAVNAAEHYSAAYKQAVADAGCTALHGTWPDDSGYYDEAGNWALRIHVATTVLPSGKTVGVVANGTSGFVAWDLDPTLDVADPQPPVVRKLVPNPVSTVRAVYEFVFLDDRFFCGDSYHGGGWWSGYYCWAVDQPPSAGTDPSDERLFMAPVGRMSVPWDLHSELGFASTFSHATGRGLFSGDTDVAVVDYNETLYTEACQQHLDTVLTSYWASPVSSQLEVGVHEGYPGEPDFISWRDATDAGPCTGQWKDLSSPATTNPATGEPYTWTAPQDLSGLVGVYYPDWGSYPLNAQLDFPETGYSLVGNWLSGAQIIWKDVASGLHRKHAIRSWYPYAGSTANIAANHAGDRLYLWPSWHTIVGEYAISFDPLVDEAPTVAFVAAHDTTAYMAGPGGAFVHPGSGHTFAVSGVTGGVQTVDGATLTVYDLDHDGADLPEITLPFTPSDFVDFPDAVETVQLREGQGAGGYYYVPLRAVLPGSRARYYLLTLDVSADQLETPEDMAIASIIELDPVDSAGDGDLYFSGELSGYLHLSAQERLGVFAPFVTSGTLVDLAAWKDGVRQAEGFSGTPRLVRKLAYVPPEDPEEEPSCTPGQTRIRACGIQGTGAEDATCGSAGTWGPWSACVDPDADLLVDATTYKIGFRHVAYYDSGYWYFRSLIPALPGLAVYRAEIAEGPITEDNLGESIVLRPLGLIPHDRLPPYRKIVFTEEDAVVVESDGAWSVPKCHDDWR